MAKKESIEKAFYSKVKSKITTVCRDDEFFAEFYNAIGAGKKQFFQKRVQETQVVDPIWIEQIEKYLPHIDNIVRHPRTTMEAEQQVVRIERAKKINAASVAHLSSHTENVQTIREDGVVVPKKILSTTYEDKLAIYENRFVVTLISKLAAYIEIRFAAIEKSNKTYQSDRLNVQSSFNWRNYDIKVNVDMDVKENVENESTAKVQDLIKRINTLRMYVRGFVNTEFYKEIKANSNPVAAPILRTNLILHSVDYHSCLELWQFLDSYHELGFNVDIKEKDLEFDQTYEDEVIKMLIYDYSAMVVNQDDRADNYNLKPYKFRQIKAAKQVTKLEMDEEPEDQNKEMEPFTPNEYFYQQTLDNYEGKKKQLIEDGKSFKKSLTTIYAQMQAISNSVYKELLEKSKPIIPIDATYKERRKAKYEYAKKKLGVLRTVAFMKQQDLEKTLRDIDRLESEMEKYKKLEEEYKKELARQRKETLAKARKNAESLPKNEDQIRYEELVKQRRIEALAKARDNAAFARLQKEEEDRLMEEARLRSLEEERSRIEAEIVEALKAKQARDIEEKKAKLNAYRQKLTWPTFFDVVQNDEEATVLMIPKKYTPKILSLPSSNPDEIERRKVLRRKG